MIIFIVILIVFWGIAVVTRKVTRRRFNNEYAARMASLEADICQVQRDVAYIKDALQEIMMRSAYRTPKRELEAYKNRQDAGGRQELTK